MDFLTGFTAPMCSKVFLSCSKKMMNHIYSKQSCFTMLRAQKMHLVIEEKNAKRKCN